MIRRDKSFRTDVHTDSFRQESATGPMVFTATPAPYNVVLVYAESRDFRPRSEVTDSESLRSWEGLPIVIEHKDVTMTNLGEVVGYVRRAWDGQRGWLEAEIIITDGKTAARIVNGELGSLSGGYTVDSEPGAGTYEGVPYTETQRRIRMQHLAVGPASDTWARAGSEARVR